MGVLDIIWGRRISEAITRVLIVLVKEDNGHDGPILSLSLFSTSDYRTFITVYSDIQMWPALATHLLVTPMGSEPLAAGLSVLRSSARKVRSTFLG